MDVMLNSVGARIIEAQIYNLHEYYNNVISQYDGICSSYTGLYLQMRK